MPVLLEPMMNKLGLKSLKIHNWSLRWDMMQSFLMWLGFWCQVRPGANGLPLLLSLPLLPFHIIEKVLSSLVRARV
jgi:hypothetical protein